jgi:hypothetical protein
VRWSPDYLALVCVTAFCAGVGWALGAALVGALLNAVRQKQ